MIIHDNGITGLASMLSRLNNQSSMMPLGRGRGEAMDLNTRKNVVLRHKFATLNTCKCGAAP